MHKMVVLVKAVAGRVDELAHWYDETHLPDLLAVPGLVSVERHTMFPVKKPDGLMDWDFLLIYELEGEDPMVVLAAMAKQGVPVVCDALDSTKTLSLVAVSKVHKTE